MSMKLKQQKALISQLCRICGEENKQCVPILGESGKKQNILRKMHSCLPVVVEETDMMPKQICLSCLPKLDSMWEMYQLCKEGQTKIENKMHTISKRYEEEPQCVRLRWKKDRLFVRLFVEPHSSDLPDSNSFSPRSKTSTSRTGFTVPTPIPCLATSCHRLSTTIPATPCTKVLTRERHISDLCAACNEEVQHNHLGIGCEGKCLRWYHCRCVGMSRAVYLKMLKKKRTTWICQTCKNIPKSFHKPNLIEEKLKLLTENNPIRYGESAVIFLAPPSPPPPAAPNTMMILPEQVMIVEQPPVAYPPGPAKDTTLYQENLVKANSASLMHKQRVLAPKPLPPPPLKETETQPPPPRRRKEGDLPKAQRRKRTLQMCKYCNRSFPDDIIDHHVNLHLRQSFFTCIDCNKNFRSEEAMSRHRCSTNSEPINLDPE